jgi:ribonuclease J
LDNTENRKQTGGRRPAGQKNGERKNSGNQNGERKNGANQKRKNGGNAKRRHAETEARKTVPAAVKQKKPGGGDGRKQSGQAPVVRIIPLGGIGEVGKNMTVVEFGDDIIVIDAGLMFPREEMLGVDYVIPDTTYLKNNQDKFRAIFLTHGHEDHIGALPYIMNDFDVPVYGSTLTIALSEAKLSEYPHVNPEFRSVKAGDRIKAGVFDVEYIRVSHSIDDAMGLAISTPAGVIVHTGDFKIDFTPVNGKIMDLNRFAELGKKGVLALMSDSTNAERQGFTMSESQVGETFVNYFRQANGRVIVASFASNVHRIQQVIDVAKLYGRKVCLAGRSMLKYVGVAREIGYLNVSDDMLINFEDLKKLRDNQMVILTTGSQGETMSGLVRMAMGQHAKVNIKAGDTVIISATPIPGNERCVSDVINMLYRKGANVINDATDMVHVSGHANREELKLMMSLVKPKFFIPVHGEYRHLYKHAELAGKMGVKEKNVFITEIGAAVELNKRIGQMKTEAVPSGSVLIDGLGIGDVGNVVLRDRKVLASDGLFIVIVTISAETGYLLSPPDIISRGFVYMKESEELLDEAKRIAENIVHECSERKTSDWSTLKNLIKKEISSYLYEKTNRSPMILPVIIEI